MSGSIVAALSGGYLHLDLNDMSIQRGLAHRTASVLMTHFHPERFTTTHRTSQINIRVQQHVITIASHHKHREPETRERRADDDRARTPLNPPRTPGTLFAGLLIESPPRLPPQLPFCEAAERQSREEVPKRHRAAPSHDDDPPPGHLDVGRLAVEYELGLRHTPASAEVIYLAHQG